MAGYATVQDENKKQLQNIAQTCRPIDLHGNGGEEADE